jgi:thioredoxin-like negative regulator of GroEL
MQRLNRALKTDLVAILFFSDTNHVSLSTRKALGEVVRKGIQRFNLKVREVDYDNEKEVCKQYGVYGVPVTLVFCNGNLVGRHYGEITPEEFETIFKNHSEFKGDYREGL